MTDISSRLASALRTARETIMKYAKAAPGQRGLFGGGFEGGITHKQHSFNFDSPAAPKPAATPNADFERLHPRDDHGRFIEKSQMEQAKTNQRMADALRAKVTKPEERAKLDAVIGKQQGPEAAPAAPAAAPPEKTPEQAPAGTPKEIPQTVRESVKRNLDTLNQLHNDMEKAGTLGDRYRSDAAINNDKRVKAAREVIDEFRQRATKLGIDPEQLITELGGEPPRDAHDKMLNWHNEPTKASKPAEPPKPEADSNERQKKQRIDLLNQIVLSAANNAQVTSEAKTQDEKHRIAEASIQDILDANGWDISGDEHKQVLQELKKVSYDTAPTAPPPAAKPAIDMFGNPIEAPKPKPAPAPEVPSHGPQGALFNNKGLPGQMSMFEEVGVPDEMLHKSARRGTESARQPFNPENHLKIAADSIDQLRRVDVGRLLENHDLPKNRDAMADYITKNRPDLAATVKEELADIAEEAAANDKKKDEPAEVVAGISRKWTKNEDGTYTDTHGTIWKKAAAGGEISPVNGKRFAGGSLMPIHGMSQSQPKAEHGNGIGLPEKPNEDAKRPAPAPPKVRTITPEDKERIERERKWQEVANGPLGKSLGLKERPHNIQHGHGIAKEWMDQAEKLGPDKVKAIAEAAKQIYLENVFQQEKKRAEAIGGAGTTAINPAWHGGTGQPYSLDEVKNRALEHAELMQGGTSAQSWGITKKHLQNHPHTHNARQWVSWALSTGNQAETLDKLNEIAKGNATDAPKPIDTTATETAAANWKSMSDEEYKRHLSEEFVKKVDAGESGYKPGSVKIGADGIMRVYQGTSNGGWSKPALFEPAWVQAASDTGLPHPNNRGTDSDEGETQGEAAPWDSRAKFEQLAALAPNAGEKLGPELSQRRAAMIDQHKEALKNAGQWTGSDEIRHQAAMKALGLKAEAAPETAAAMVTSENANKARKLMGITQEQLDDYDPEREVFKIGQKHWGVKLTDGTEHPKVFSSRKEAVEAGKKNYELKRNEHNDPEKYHDLSSREAWYVSNEAERLMKSGVSEQEAFSRARQKLQDLYTDSGKPENRTPEVPATKAKSTTLADAIAASNKKNEPEGGWTDADKVPEDKQAPSQAATKKPAHEQTQWDYFSKHKNYDRWEHLSNSQGMGLRDAQEIGQRIRSEHRDKVKAALDAGKIVPQEVLKDYPDLKQELEKKLRDHDLKYAGPRGPASQAPAPNTKEYADDHSGLATTLEQLGKRTWQRTQSQMASAAGGYMPAAKHREHVEKAIAEGKTVPPEVLKDYPDLAEKHQTKSTEQNSVSAEFSGNLLNSALNPSTPITRPKFDKDRQSLADKLYSQVNDLSDEMERQGIPFSANQENRILNSIKSGITALRGGVKQAGENYTDGEYNAIHKSVLKSLSDLNTMLDQSKANSASESRPEQANQAAGLFPTQPAEEKPKTPRVRKAISEAANKLGIADFGEVIPGARKHTAAPTGPKPKKEELASEKDNRPAWARRYRVAEDANNPGEYFIVDERTNTPYFDEERSQAGSFSRKLERMLGSRRKGNNFKSKEEAEKKIANIEVKRNHGVGMARKPADGMKEEYVIFRNVSDRKKPVVRRGFATREEAEKHLNDNPAEIIEHKFPDYETYQYLDRVERHGKEVRKGDIKPKDFQDVFNFTGGQFGNWQMNKDGQTSLNHAYDALHDLADTLGLPPRAMALNGQLSIGFGARGHGGKHSARAHYEPDNKVINLTKMAGAGTLAHEWSHALDHYVGELAHGKGENYGISKGGWKAGNIRPELKAAAKALRDSLHSKEVTSVIEAPKEVTASREDKEHEELRKAKENNTSVSYPRTVPALLWNVRQSMHDRARWKKKKLDPKLLKEFDELSEKIGQGDYGKQTNVSTPNSRFGGYSTFENVEKLNQLHKKMVGSSFHTADRDSTGNTIYHRIIASKAQEQRVKDAQAGKTETKRKDTNYATEASHMDMFQSGDYYSEPQEMFARAFEAYMDDKITKAGNRSDYLIGKGTTDNKRYAMYDMKPFPEGEEREAINQAFDNFFKELRHQEREDAKGKHVELYQSNRTPRRYSARLQRALGQAISALT